MQDRYRFHDTLPMHNADICVSTMQMCVRAIHSAAEDLVVTLGSLLHVAYSDGSGLVEAE